MEKHYIVDGNAAKKIAEDLSAFLVAIGADEKTRLIGITQTELAALKRGASLLLCVAVTEQPIVAGQEIVAIAGYKPGNAPRMDTERVRLRVTADLFDVDPLEMKTATIARVTGHPVRSSRPLADIDLTEHFQGICSEAKDFDPATSKRGLPVAVMS